MAVESALTRQWRQCYEMARDECQRLREDNERLREDLAKARADLAGAGILLARFYQVSQDTHSYIFDRDMKAEFAAIDAAREG